MKTMRRPSGLNDGDTLSLPRPTESRRGEPPPAGTLYRSTPLSSPCAYTTLAPSGVKIGEMNTPLPLATVRPRPPMSCTTICEGTYVE